MGATSNKPLHVDFWLSFTCSKLRNSAMAAMANSICVIRQMVSHTKGLPVCIDFANIAGPTDTTENA